MERKNWIGLLIIALVVGSYFLSNALYDGGHDDEEYSVTGYGSLDLPDKGLIAQIFSEILYLVIAGCGLVFMIGFVGVKKYKLIWIIVVSQILVTAWFMSGTGLVHGRYVDILFPLILISCLGVLKLKEEEFRKDYLLIGFYVSLIASVFCRSLWVDTINSFISFFGYLPVKIILPIFPVIELLMVLWNKQAIKIFIVLMLLITFTLSNVSNFKYVEVASGNAYKSAEIGRYLAEHKINDVSFDKDDYKNYWASYCLIRYWYGKDLRVEEVNNQISGWLISSKTLGGEKVIEQKNLSALENGNSSLKLYII
ncbi:MAG: hypothetical protein DRP18_04490 [Candidatus Aenigmatarchaeota archaeon]|nr:MAG: hypothetical protein DRP18_04490 [Candidatus Aenigmarchaeota archaeon]